MRVTSNSLRDMVVDHSAEFAKAPRPDPSFVSTALPGFKRTIQARRAIREFDHKRLSEEVMRDCLHDATLAPSSSNLQIYELYWVRDSNCKVALAEACLGQPSATTAGELVVVVARGDLWKRNLRTLLDIMSKGGRKPLDSTVDDYYRYVVPMRLKTDVLGLNNLIRRMLFWYMGRSEPTMRSPISRVDHRVYAHVQASLVAQTLMLSIAAHGYESCPIGAFDGKRIDRLLNLPKGAEVSMVIAIGRGLSGGVFGPRVRLPESDLIREI